MVIVTCGGVLLTCGGVLLLLPPFFSYDYNYTDCHLRQI